MDHSLNMLVCKVWYECHDVEASIVEMPKLADPEPLAATVASIRGSRRLSQRLQEASSRARTCQFMS
eukprot:2582263-Amphidinium_carterae.1